MESTLCHPETLTVIETFGYCPTDGFQRLEAHLTRGARTCADFGYTFDEAAIRTALAQINGDHLLRCRLAVDADGFTLTHAPIAPVDRVWSLAISDTRLSSNDPWLRVKTSQRAVYDTARAALPDGIDELIFLNERDEVCEGTITNVFAEMNGTLVTPALSSGVLPGILRQTLICAKRAKVGKLTLDDLRIADTLYVGNSLRGLIKARLT